MAVIKVDNIAPVADAVAEAAVLIMVEPFGMRGAENRIRGGVVIHNVDDALHSVRMDRVNKFSEVLCCAEFRIDRAVIRDRIGGAEGTLALNGSDRMDGHEPDDIRAERADFGELLFDSAKTALLRIIADKYLIHYHVSQTFLSLFSHVDLPDALLIVIVHVLFAFVKPISGIV